MKTIPFTYYLYHKPTGKKYYGVRYRKGCHPSQLWTTYFSSSKFVKQLIDQYGKESFQFQIRKTFILVSKARLWEEIVIRRLRAHEKEEWLNQVIPNQKWINRKHSLETKQKISKKMKGRIVSKETRNKQRIAALNRPTGWHMPKKGVIRRANLLRNRPRPEIVKQQISQTKTGTKRFYLPNGSFKMIKPN